MTQNEYYEFGFCRGHQLGKCHAYKLKDYYAPIAIANLIIEHEDFYIPRLKEADSFYVKGCLDGFLLALGYTPIFKD